MFWNITRVESVVIVQRVFVPQLSCDLADLKAGIIVAVKNIDAPMLTRVWHELEYRIDVCRVTRGAHGTHRTSLVVKKNFFSFLVAVNNSINLWAPCVLYIRTDVSLLSRERFLYI